MIWVWGWHVLQAIVNNRSRKIFKIYSLRQHENRIFSLINKINAEIEIVDNKFLDKHFGQNHQGIAAYVSQIEFKNLKAWIKKQGETSLLVACDLLNDAHNLGAIIRTSRALGANGMLVTDRKSAPFNGHLVKATAGALESFDVVQVVNLANSLEILKDNDYKIYGLDHRGKSTFSIAKRSVIVLGQEGGGLRELTKKRCDDMISIRTQEDFGVLNVSVAAGIILSKFLGGK